MDSAGSSPAPLKISCNEHTTHPCVLFRAYALGRESVNLKWELFNADSPFFCALRRNNFTPKG